MPTTTPIDDGSRDARRQIAAAAQRAVAEGKHIAVVFGASWCPDSNAFDKALEHRLVKPLVEPSYVVVPLDVGQRDRCLALMGDYGLEVSRGVPSLAILDAQRQLLGALRDGELRNARAMSLVEIATIFHRWAPAGKRLTAARKEPTVDGKRPAADRHG